MREQKERSVWLAKFVMPYEPALRQWLMRYRAPGLEIDDIVQETYAILAGLPSTDDIRNPRSYAFQTAYSIVLSYRRRARIVSITPVADMETFQNAADQPSPEAAVCDRDELQAVVAAVSNLPDRIREVFVLRKFDGLSQREVAQHLGISENIVEKSVAKALQALLNGFKRGGNAPADPPDRQERQRAGFAVVPGKDSKAR
jgi:RNA polymerase sigma-70 factor (ECF subfamily)